MHGLPTFVTCHLLPGYVILDVEQHQNRSSRLIIRIFDVTNITRTAVASCEEMRRNECECCLLV
jgi:hypothetical protein